MGSKQVRVDKELVKEINKRQGKDFTTRLLNWHRKNQDKNSLTQSQVREACRKAIQQAQR